MAREFLLVAILTSFCGSALNAGWPWLKTPEPQSEPLVQNPFEGKGFIEYSGSGGTLKCFMFTSDSTGMSRDYNIGGPWMLFADKFTYVVRPEKKEIQISFGGPPSAYKYNVDGRIITLSDLNQTRELVEAVQPFFWQDGKFDAPDGVNGRSNKERQEAFLKDYIARARIQKAGFYAAPVDESFSKFLLVNITTGKLRDDRVWEVRTPLQPGQIVTIDGVSAQVIPMPKAGAPPISKTN